jgi:hypothetical protein
MSNARFQGNGVDVLIEGLQAAHESPGDIRDKMWQAVWARGYNDVVIPLPMPDTKIDGFVILERRYSEKHTIVLVDDGERLIGMLDEFPEVSLGSKVRLQPLYGINVQWSLKVLAQLGCGLQIRFDEAERGDTQWIDRMRTCLLKIREIEAGVRRQIDSDRRRIQFVTAPMPFRTEMEAADKELRERVLAGGYNEEEKRMLARAKSQDAVNKVINIRNKRLVDEYRQEVVRFREQIPELKRAWDKKMEDYAEYRKHVDRCNEVDAASRSITDATLKASEQLNVIETAVLNVRAPGLSTVEESPKSHLNEILATIELLFELVPKRLQKTAAPAAS